MLISKIGTKLWTFSWIFDKVVKWFNKKFQETIRNKSRSVYVVFVFQAFQKRKGVEFLDPRLPSF